MYMMKLLVSGGASLAAAAVTNVCLRHVHGMQGGNELLAAVLQTVLFSWPPLLLMYAPLARLWRRNTAPPAAVIASGLTLAILSAAMSTVLMQLAWGSSVTHALSAFGNGDGTWFMVLWGTSNVAALGAWTALGHPELLSAWRDS
jgi:hypothetical protein